MIQDYLLRDVITHSGLDPPASVSSSHAYRLALFRQFHLGLPSQMTLACANLTTGAH